MPLNVWSRTTRFLHLGLAVTVTLQLFLSLVMEAPEPGEVAAGGIFRQFFEAHEVIGLSALVFVVCHWVWLATAKDTGFRHLFPWDAEGRREIVADLKGIFNRHLPEGGPRGGLVGLVHGLGFLAVTGMVITGGAIFGFITTNALASSAAHTCEELHELCSNFVWVYWFGHGSMALIHHLAGHDTLRQMFAWKS
jgi:cytochrome b561